MIDGIIDQVGDGAADRRGPAGHVDAARTEVASLAADIRDIFADIGDENAEVDQPAGVLPGIIVGKGERGVDHRIHHVEIAEHPALLLVDTISSLASIDYRHKEWGVDVTIAGSQKGLMLPPGLSFNAVSVRGLEASKTAKLPRSYWDWRPMLEANAGFYFPYTPATNLLRGLKEALTMLEEEGLPNVFARHDRHAAATRAAVQAWGRADAVELQCQAAADYSSSLTAIRLSEGFSADELRALILRRFNMSLGNGLGILKDRVFRIGHLGDINDLTLLGAVSGVEMGLKLAGVPTESGGVDAAMASLTSA